MAVIYSMFAVFLPLILLGLLFFVMWIMMLVDAATRKYKNDTDKVVWVLVVVLLGIIGALVYYFVIFAKDDEKSIKWLWITMLILFVLWVFFIFLAFITAYVNNPATF